MKDFHKLKVWEISHKLTLNIYQISQNFPKEEIYGLTNQMRRSAASIPSNISEGCGRNSKAETIQFLNIAIGSMCEPEYQLLLSHDLHYINDKSYQDLTGVLVGLRKMTYAFVQRLREDKK